MELKYAYVPQNQSKVAKALGKDIDVSFKKAVVVCDKLRGMKLEEAITLLEAVVALEQPIPFKKYKDGTSHKPGMGPAKYPKKAAGEILKILKNAQTNAEYKGLDTGKLQVINIQANKGPSRKRRKPKGRWKAWKTQYVSVMAIVKEK